MHKIVECSVPLLELKHTVASDVEEKIADFIAPMIEDGATIQLGIGGIPDAVLARIEGKQHLGIHTEMVSDGL